MPEDLPRGEALCAEVGGDIWFPRVGENATPAIRICGRCGIREQCLQVALDNFIEYGIWGGYTERGRRRLRRERRAAA